MKAILSILCAVLALPSFAQSLDVGDNPLSPATPVPVVVAAPQIVYLPTPQNEAQKFEATALQWIGSLTVVAGALATFLAMIWAKVNAITARQDRQAANTGAMQGQLTNVAIAAGVPPPPPLPADPNPEPQKVPPAGAVAIVAGVAICLLSACATSTGDPARDARGRATNQALVEASKVLGKVAVQALFTVASQEATGARADFGQAAASGLWQSVDAQSTAAAIGRVVDAYGAGKLPKTQSATEDAASTAIAAGKPPTQVARALAAVISTAAGAPPAL